MSTKREGRKGIHTHHDGHDRIEDDEEEVILFTSQNVCLNKLNLLSSIHHCKMKKRKLFLKKSFALNTLPVCLYNQLLFNVYAFFENHIRTGDYIHYLNMVFNFLWFTDLLGIQV